jgi:replicative DNA helicase
MEAGLRCYFTDSFSTDLRLPQSGLVIIGGRTSHGKTSLMVNMLVSFLKAEVQRKVIYYSLEIPASRLILKILMTLSQESYSQSQVENFNIYRQKILDGQLPAWDNISKLLGDRLLINDEPISISSLVSRLDCESNHGALVFIDYIQLIGSDSKDQRYLAIKHFADSLRAVANKRGMVVIGGSQLTAGETAYSDSVREGKDLEMAAELVLRCWNKQVARANGAIRKDEGDYYADIPGNFVINVCKNRSGVAGAKFGFDFDGFVLKHVKGL